MSLQRGERIAIFLGRNHDSSRGPSRSNWHEKREPHGRPKISSFRLTLSKKDVDENNLKFGVKWGYPKVLKIKEI